MLKTKNGNGAVMDLTRGSVPKTLLSFSLPFMLSTLLQTLYSTVDSIVVGQALQSAGLSGVSVGSQIMQMMYMFCIGFINAGQVIISQAKGANNGKKTQDAIGTIFFITLGVAVLLTAVCLIFCDPMLRLMNTPEESYEYARSYVLICGGFLIFTAFYNMFSAILRGLGDSRHPLLFVVIASFINLGLDLLFILKFRWGVAGAAWATIIGQAVSVVFCFVYLTRHGEKLGFAFTIRRMRFDGETAGQMTKIGIPMAIQSAAIQVSFLFVSSMINDLGVNVSAAFGATQKIRNLPGILTQGLRLGISSMVGQNLGARKLDRVDKIVRWGILFCAAVGIVFGAVFLAAPEGCFRLFTQDEAVLAFASIAMLTICIELPGHFVMGPCGALVQAQGFVIFSMIMSFTDAFAGRIFLTWLLGNALNMGALGYFLGYTLATYLTAIPQFIYYITGLWKKRAALVEQEKEEDDELRSAMQ